MFLVSGDDASKPRILADRLWSGLSRELRRYTRGVTLFRAASTVSLLTLASRVTGLGRELLMAAFFGAGAMTDAFNVAFRLPNLLRRLFGEGAFSQAFVPLLAGARATKGDDETRELIDRVGTALFWVLVVVSSLGVLAAPLLVWLIASGLERAPHGFDVAVLMTRIMFPYIAFMSLVAFASGVLNTWKRFAVPAATPVLLNVSMIAAILWGAPWLQAQGVEPILALAFGVMAGGLLQLALQVAALAKLGIVPDIGMAPRAIAAAWRSQAVRDVLRLMLPALLGVSVAQVSLLINTQIASYQATGSVSWLSYADRLMEFPTALLGVALGVVLTPQLAGAKAAGDSERYSSMLDWGLRLVVLLAVPGAVGLLCFSVPLVATVFHYGAFRDSDVGRVAVALMGYGTGLVGLVAIKVLAPGFYASQDMRTPVRIAIVVLGITQLLNLVFVPWMGHAGLALSIGLGALVNALWLLASLLRRGSYRPRPGWARFAAQVAAGCVALAALLLVCAQSFDWIALRAQPGLRAALMAGVLAASAVLYFGVVRLCGLRWRALLRA